MPCDRIYTTNVNLEVADRDLLITALEALGWQPRVEGQRCWFTVPRQGRGRLDADGLILWTGNPDHGEAVATLIRQAYARQAVVSAAARYGWRVQTKGPQQLTLTRRV